MNEKNNTTNEAVRFYTVMYVSKVDYDFSVEVRKLGAFSTFAAALERLKKLVEEFKVEREEDLAKFADDELYPEVNTEIDEYNGRLQICDCLNTGYWGCEFGYEDDFELHEIYIDEWTVES